MKRYKVKFIDLPVREEDGSFKGKLVKVEAYVRDGLAIHHSPNDNTLRRRWVVSHELSGYAVRTGIETRKDAEILLDQIAPLTDWENSTKDVLITNSELKRKVRDILRSYSYAF